MINVLIFFAVTKKLNLPLPNQHQGCIADQTVCVAGTEQVLMMCQLLTSSSLSRLFGFRILVRLLCLSTSQGFFLPSNQLSRAARCPCHAAANDHDNDVDACFFESLLHRFQGDFDNYRQVVEDRQQGLMPREGGGHEHIHCLLIPVKAITADNASVGRLAAFYFDGIPQRIFRFRYYELTVAWSPSGSARAAPAVDMTLYCLHPTLEGQLQAIQDPMLWPMAVADFVHNNAMDNDEGDTVVTLLPNCNVRWTRELDPVQHDYAQKHNDLLQKGDNCCDSNCDLGIHAVMVHGQAIVNSTMIPGTKIRVLDQLSLWQDQFWIHDRGFDPNTGAFIYGNQRGVPYQLERVTELVASKRDDEDTILLRHVVDEDLQWTLGPQWRTEEEYTAKLQVVGGGVSSQLNTAKVEEK
jgi:CpeT/CpcT family (DUF1001)